MNSWGGGNSWLRRPFRSDRKSRGTPGSADEPSPIKEAPTPQRSPAANAAAGGASSHERMSKSAGASRLASHPPSEPSEDGGQLSRAASHDTAALATHAEERGGAARGDDRAYAV